MPVSAPRPQAPAPAPAPAQQQQAAPAAQDYGPAPTNYAPAYQPQQTTEPAPPPVSGGGGGGGAAMDGLRSALAGGGGGIPEAMPNLQFGTPAEGNPNLGQRNVPLNSLKLAMRQSQLGRVY